MIDKSTIQSNIQKAFSDAHVVVESDDGVHFFVQVASKAFAGKSLLEQHRMVYDAVGSGVGVEIHALSIKTTVLE